MSEDNTPTTLISNLARQAWEAAHTLATLPTQTKNQVLHTLAERVEQQAKTLAQANAQDLASGESQGLTGALLDRLRLTPERLATMVAGLRTVAELPDSVGEVMETIERPNGLRIRKVSTPIGVIGIIYESRPNVTIDCAALCLKSGNAAILRGGKEAFYSNAALAELIGEALETHGVPKVAVQLIPTTDRAALTALLKQDRYVHCIIPRGGEGLIRFVTEHARMPVIKHYKGVCCLYIDKAADADLAEQLTVNAKCQRPGVCNAIENLFIHQAVAETLWPRLAQALANQQVELRVDEQAAALLQQAAIPCRSQLATEADYHEEFLDLILSVKVVPSLEAAIAAVNTYGSGHSDAIITRDEATARQFMAAVDSATLYWNASTRFTDGFEFGLGAEIGISTDKLHARGPMGLRELCTYKYLIFGRGQQR